MQYRITPLDPADMTGHPSGRHRIEFGNGFQYLVTFDDHIKSNTSALDFDRCRRWFNENYGWSQDLDTRDTLLKNRKRYPEAYQPNDINPVWSYSVRFSNDYRIYVADMQTLNWFVLCHPR